MIKKVSNGILNLNFIIQKNVKMYYKIKNQDFLGKNLKLILNLLYVLLIGPNFILMNILVIVVD